MRRNWKLHAVAVFSLAIAMALSVAALSLSNALLLRPPLARDPGRLVTIFTLANGASESVSYPDYAYLRDHNRAFTGIAAFNYGFWKYLIERGDSEELVQLDAVSDNYFEVMGIRPFLGRFFAPGDDRRRVSYAVLTYSCWRRWGADPHVAGKTIRIGHNALTIAGVAPREFLGPEFGLAADVIVNLGAASNVGGVPLDNREMRALLLIGRLQPGVTRSQARAETRALWSQLAAAFPAAEHDRTADLMPAGVLPPDQIPTARLISAVLIAAVLLILLIACANTANLLLALAAGRRQEALIKTALGASRRRLIGEFLRDTLTLCAAGGALGFALAALALRAGSRFDIPLPMIGVLPVAADLHPGALVAALTLALVLAAGMASGIAPALYASQPDLAGALSGEISIGGTRRGRIRFAVVAVQAAVCTVVLVGAGLATRSLYNLRHVDPGFSARNVLMLVLGAGHLPAEQQPRVYDSILRAVAHLPGVEAAALSDDLLLGGDSGDRDEIRFTDRPAGAQKVFVDRIMVDENFFSTLGIRLLAGRGFRASDRPDTPEVIIISRFMAEKFWPHQDAVGRTIRIVDGGHPEGRPARIIGVARDGKYTKLEEPMQPFMYLALGQHYQPDFRLVLRTAGDPKRWAEPVTQAVRRLGVKVPIAPITMESWLNLTLLVPRVMFYCAAGLSLLAMLLAAFGLYGAISYSVAGRRRELGIRIALGARPSQLMRLIFRETLAMVGAGVTGGTALGAAAGDAFRAQFFGIAHVEWTVLAPVALGVLAAALAIAFAAARRFTRMHPMEAVRHA